MWPNNVGRLPHESGPSRPYRGSAISRFVSAVVAINSVRGIIVPIDSREEGRWALPHGEFGLDVIALVGMLRYASHWSIPAHPSGPL